ncbi:MAG: hypothetical protein ACTS6P_00325 [Candidatus Hodgkinia cicadicola]
MQFTSESQFPSAEASPSVAFVYNFVRNATSLLNFPSKYSKVHSAVQVNFRALPSARVKPPKVSIIWMFYFV